MSSETSYFKFPSNSITLWFVVLCLYQSLLLIPSVKAKFDVYDFADTVTPINQYSEFTNFNNPSLLCNVGGGKCINIKHNGTKLADSVNFVSYGFSLPLNINNTGTYTCETYNCDNQDDVTVVESIFILIIDSSRVNVPEWQFVFLNENHTLICDSDAYDLTVKEWSKVHNETITTATSGVINTAQLSDEGNYTCEFTILGNNNTKTTQLIVLVKPKIVVTPENHLQTAVGPSVNNYTITYNAKSPGKENITWYHNGIELADRFVHQPNVDMGGSSTISVYRRQHKGTYRVVIESLFNGIEVSEYISQESVTDYTFVVDVTVPPSPPELTIIQINPFDVTISLTPTNVTLDDSPDLVNLTLYRIGGGNDSRTLVGVASLTHNEPQYKFTSLIPATQYSVGLVVENIDKVITVGQQVLKFTTETSEPSYSNVSIVRNGISEFNLSLSFNYLGAPSLSIIRLGYRPAAGDSNHFQYIDVTEVFDDLSQLNHTVQLSLNNVSTTRLQVVLEITNSDGKTITTSPISETVEPLSAVLTAPISTFLRNSVSVKLQLPSKGTPPILEVSVSFSSSAHTYLHNILGPFVTGDLITVTVDKDSGEDGRFPLRGNTRYTVRGRARNFAGWGSYSDGKAFTTYPAIVDDATNNSTITDDSIGNIVRTTSASSASSLPVWAIILSGVIPCVTLVLIIVSSILFVLLIKKYRKRPSKSYPINERTAADSNRLDHSPGETRRVGKYFSYERPLMPRPATAEPSFDSFPYPPSSSHDDSDSESNLTSGAPKYKYVVSPSHNEIGIQGFLGATPGSGTYVYV